MPACTAASIVGYFPRTWSGRMISPVVKTERISLSRASKVSLVNGFASTLSGIDAVRLKDGRIVLIFNNSYNKRTPLNLAVSKDGEHFTVFKTLEDGPGQYSYPAIVQAANGDLMMTYSWRRETIKFVRVGLGDVPK